MAEINVNVQLITELQNCSTECNICLAACLDEEDVSMMARCIELNTDCSGICTLAASFLARDSESVATLLALCSEICRACADECMKHDAEHCKKCANICYECARMCSEY